MSDFATPLSHWTPLAIAPTTTAQQFTSVGCRLLRIQNADAAIKLYLGDSSLTSSGLVAHTFGYVGAGAVEYLEVNNPSLFWYCSSSGTPTVYASYLTS